MSRHMRTYVRVDPPCRPRLVLRVGRAARRSTPARPAGDRRGRHRPRRELRGEGTRRPHRDGRDAGTPSLPAGRRRRAALPRLRRREQGRLPRLRRRLPGRRGHLDRRGVPRRPWARAHLRHSARDRDPAPSRRPRGGRAADHRRGRAHEVPREGRERGREAGRPARRPGRRRARLPPSAADRAAVGRRAGDGGEAPPARDHDGRPGGRNPGAGARVDARPRLGAAASTRSRTTATRGPSCGAADAARSARSARSAAVAARRRRSTRS